MKIAADLLLYMVVTGPGATDDQLAIDPLIWICCIVALEKLSAFFHVPTKHKILLPKAKRAFPAMDWRTVSLE